MSNPSKAILAALALWVSALMTWILIVIQVEADQLNPNIAKLFSHVGIDLPDKILELNPDALITRCLLFAGFLILLHYFCCALAGRSSTKAQAVKNVDRLAEPTL